MEEAVKTMGPVDLKEAFKAVKPNDLKLLDVEEKAKVKQDKIVEAVVSKLKPVDRETLLGKRRSAKSADEPVAPTEIAAWEKFDDLVTPVTKLRLPGKFALLQRIHSAIDCICKLSADRDQPAVFHRVKKAAENIIGRYSNDIILHMFKNNLIYQGDHSGSFKAARRDRS